MPQNKTKIALVCLDKIGKNMAGPGIRYFEMAKALTKYFDVVLLATEFQDIEINCPGLTTKIYNQRKPTQTIFPAVSDCRCVLAQSLRPPLIYKLKKAGIHFIADLYDPIIIETLEYFKYDNIAKRNHIFDFHLSLLSLSLVSADHIMCASDKQRNFYLGLLTDRKIINPSSYSGSPKLNTLISLVPFGLSKEMPKIQDKTAFEKNYPGILPDDKIVYWGGGIWNWFDPITVIKAIEQISKKRSDVKLFFLGVKHPNPEIKEMEMAAKALSYCKEHDLLDKFVFFNFGWTPYEERVNYLMRASVGISAHFENLETCLSFRTRILDYLWAELPMVLTKGDAMADLTSQKNLGKVIDYEDVRGMAQSILEIIDNPKLTETIKSNINQVRPEFYWDKITTDLAESIKEAATKPIKFDQVKLLKLLPAYYISGFKKKFLTK